MRQDLLGPSMHVKMGCDARDVLKPSQPKDSKARQKDKCSRMTMTGAMYLDVTLLPRHEMTFTYPTNSRFNQHAWNVISRLK